MLTAIDTMVAATDGNRLDGSHRAGESRGSETVHGGDRVFLFYTVSAERRIAQLSLKFDGRSRQRPMRPCGRNKSKSRVFSWA